MKIFQMLLLLGLCCGAEAQDYFVFEKDRVILDNGSVRRVINISGNKVSSSELYISTLKDNFIAAGNEFSFTINGKLINGRGGWKLVSHEKIADQNGGKGVKLSLLGEIIPVSIELNYLLYPGLPLVRKWIAIRNTGEADLNIEDLNIEDLETRIGYVHAVVYHNYARMKHIGPFVGNWDDPVVVIHEFERRMGMAVGNESPVALKRTAYHTNGNNIEAGLTHNGQPLPFRKWIKPGEKWESPRVFVCLYSGTDNAFDVVNNDVNSFIVRHMNTRIVKTESKPVFVYNTWNPFRTFVNDSLVREVAKAAADCGIEEFIIDDGWQVNEKAPSSEKGWGNNYGDWNVDTKKFPGGLKPTFDYIKSLGMKPGVWMSIGSATPDAAVYRQHPEWFVKNAEGEPGNLHEGRSNPDFITSCMATEWPEYIKGKLLGMVKDYGLSYAKLDFSVLTSAYVNDDSISGCYSTDHPYHRDHRESFIMIYERLLKLFDDLHAEAPDLFIDCTFETAGKLQLMDYAIAQHAEGNWLSNIEQPFPTGALRVRHLAWWRSPALPASSLVIGNLQMNEENFEFGLKSLIGTLPIVLGDPTKLAPAQRSRIKQWSEWMQDMQKKHDYMSFRKDLPGFGEPAEGSWDGWMRLNTITGSGGILGVFRQNAAESKRMIVLRDLDPVKTYVVKLAPEGRVVTKATGKSLMEKGFEVMIEKSIDGKIFEVTGY